MKHIGFIFFLLIFSELPVFGQLSNNELQVSEENAEKLPKPTETGVINKENDGTAQKQQTQLEQNRRVLRIANDYALAADEVLTTLIMIAGDARLQGSITGNMLVLGGNVVLTPGSRIDGTLEIVGGQVSGSVEGVANLRVSNRWKMVPAAVKLVMHPYIFWKTTDKQRNLQLTIAKSALFLLMYLLIAFVFLKPINATSDLLVRRPISSILFGVLMLPVIPLFLTLLTLSIIGIPFMLLVFAFLVPLAVFGKTVIFLTLGSTIFSGRLRPLGVIFSYILYFMATALPYIDWVTFLLVNAISIGLCVLSGISTMLSQNPRRNTPSLPSSGWESRSERI